MVPTCKHFIIIYAAAWSERCNIGIVTWVKMVVFSVEKMWLVYIGNILYMQNYI